MHGVALAILDHDVIVAPEGARRVLRIIDALDTYLVQGSDQLNAQRLVTPLPGNVHHLEVTDDHSLIRRAWQTMTLKHVLGHSRRGRRAFELAAADGLVFDQVVEQITEMRALADLAGHVLQHCGGCLTIHCGNGFLRQRGQQQLQPARRLTQWQKSRILCSSRFLDQGPAQRRIQTRRPAMTQSIKRQVTPLSVQWLEQSQIVRKSFLVGRAQQPIEHRIGPAQQGGWSFHGAVSNGRKTGL
ncbi:hypothetical protein D3C84_600970 [compost metagenome]